MANDSNLKQQSKYKVPKGKYGRTVPIDDKLQQRRDRFSKQLVESYGFISRGEYNLLQTSEKERYEFFNKILGNFIDYCQDNTTFKVKDCFPGPIEDNVLVNSQSKSITIESILSNLRKLREALINLPCDEFSIKVYLFSIRIAANIGHYQTYIPSITYLLQQDICPEDKQEIVTILILHVMHFNNENSLAIAYWYRYLPKDIQLKQLICSWIGKDYYNWIKIYNNENDNSKFTIMKFGLKTMMNHMIKCISLSYYSLEYEELLLMLPKGVSLQNLIDDFRVDWTKPDNNSRVTIRKRK